MHYLKALEVLAGLFDPSKGQEHNRHTLLTVSTELGFPYVICAPVRNHPGSSQNWAFTTYPRSWQDLYQEKNYLERNPIRKRALLTAKPFTWSSLEAELPLPERELFTDCRACGMQEGVVIPIHGPWGQVITVGFASDYPLPVSADNMCKLHALAHQFVLGFLEDSHLSTIQLTDREQEIMVHVASGYSGYQIAKILNLSPNSIEWHMRNIFNKLCVRSRTAAIVKAIQLGLIEI